MLDNLRTLLQRICDEDIIVGRTVEFKVDLVWLGQSFDNILESLKVFSGKSTELTICAHRLLEAEARDILQRFCLDFGFEYVQTERRENEVD